MVAKRVVLKVFSPGELARLVSYMMERASTVSLSSLAATMRVEYCA